MHWRFPMGSTAAVLSGPVPQAHADHRSLAPNHPVTDVGPLASVPTILRRKQVEAATGYSRSTIYLRIQQGLWPRPLKLGPHIVGWLAKEVVALNGARISGQDDNAIRALVCRLEAARREGAQ